MITNLHIKNIGIIDDITIDFNNGFNVLTGETGAGKSLIINSIDMILGGRFSKDMIRKGTKYAAVEMCIYIPELNESFDDDYVVVSREVHLNGKNLCKIDGRLVTVNELKDFMKNIINIHGQYDNQTLMESKTHINFLDDFCGKNLEIYLNEYKRLYIEYISLKSELNKNYGDEIEKQRKLDILNYQLTEINDANLRVNEEQELDEKKKIITNCEKISNALNLSTFKLENNILCEIDNILRPLEKIESIDNRYGSKVSSIKGIYYELQEHLNDLNDYKYELDFDDEECRVINQRLDLIYSLKRKYGSNIEEILNYKNKIEQEITDIENSDEYNRQIKMKILKIKESLQELSNNMNNIRKDYAKILEKSINKELKELEMINASFKVDITFNEEMDFKDKGLNNVEFLISTNTGEDYKPLTKIASGGEISRIMLAIKTVLSDVDKVKTIVFDEIDTGISGSAVKAVSEKIKKISKKHQILVVTHQAILAASADYNYQIKKIVNNGKTTTSIKLLKEKEIIEEIAKISNGAITTIAIQHALELRRVSTL